MFNLVSSFICESFMSLVSELIPQGPVWHWILTLRPILGDSSKRPW